MKRYLCRLQDIASKLFSVDPVLKMFRQCWQVLQEHHVKPVCYYELFHEFGHVIAAYEHGGVVTFIKVDRFVFVFDKGKMRYQMAHTFESCVLVHFESDVNLSYNMRCVALGGVVASSLAMGTRCPSLKVYLFNKQNSIHCKRMRIGSDRELYRRFQSDDDAKVCNEKARELAVAFQESDDYASVLRLSKLGR